MLEIELSSPCPDWPKGLKRQFDRLLSAVCESLNLEEERTVSIVLADDVFVRKLNKEYRGKDKPTNVLSFPQDTGDDPIAALESGSYGDIVLALETVQKEALEQEKSFDDHLSHLIIHGFLHLLGYDHEDDRSAAEMENLEIAILNRFGIKNPYEIV